MDVTDPQRAGSVRTVRELRKIWDKRFTALCRERKIRTSGGYGYLTSDTYISSVALVVNRRGGDVSLSWWTDTKPLAIDPILWKIFMPHRDLGGDRKRLSLRVNGVFTAAGLKLSSEQVVIPGADDPDLHITRCLDQFEADHAEFTANHPTISEFLGELRTRTTVPKLAPSRHLLRVALTLIAVGREDEAAQLVETAISAGDDGPMMGAQGWIFPLIAAYCRNEIGTD